MKPTTPLLLLSLGATSTLARNHNSTDTPPTSQCHRLARLTSLAALASDPAALAAKSQGDPARAEELQAKAAAAAPELAALRGNETFVAMCASQVNSTTTGGGWGGDWDDCKKLEKLRERVKLGVNATTTEGMREAKWVEKLKVLEGNETLVAECAAKTGGGGSAGAGGKLHDVPARGLDGLLTGRQWHRRRRGALGAPSRRVRRRGRRRSRRRIRRLSAVLAGRWSRLGRRLGCWGLCCLERCFFERGVVGEGGAGGKGRWDVSPLGGCHGVEELVLRFCIDLESAVWFICWSWKEGCSWSGSEHTAALVGSFLSWI